MVNESRSCAPWQCLRFILQFALSALLFSWYLQLPIPLPPPFHALPLFNNISGSKHRNIFCVANFKHMQFSDGSLWYPRRDLHIPLILQQFIKRGTISQIIPRCSQQVACHLPEAMLSGPSAL